ncbi:MAG: response regulator [Bacteroidota bacterium]
MENLEAHSLNVMIVDDDEISNFIYRKVIDGTGISKTINDFQQARVALDYLVSNLKHKSALPDLIFLDINMPVINGWGFLDEYRSNIQPHLPKKIVICMLSSSVYKEDIERAKGYSYVNEYISKPLTRDSLQKVVKKFF